MFSASQPASVECSAERCGAVYPEQTPVGSATDWEGVCECGSQSSQPEPASQSKRGWGGKEGAGFVWAQMETVQGAKKAMAGRQEVFEWPGAAKRSKCSVPLRPSSWVEDFGDYSHAVDMSESMDWGGGTGWMRRVVVLV